MENPFPGPQPYRASDRDRFFGREDMAIRLEANVVANRCVTVYGPSGAGKSSLMQAAVIPSLVATHGVRAVRVDGWPEGEDPTRWLASAVYAQLGMGEAPADLAPAEAIFHAAQRAARRSPRILLVYLDQIEQLLYATRPADAVDAFFESMQALVDLPLRNARVALSLREDYLGRFRDRLRGRRRLLENGFRVGMLTVGELCEAVCQAAAAGEPPQTWSPDQMRALMLQVRAPGEAPTDAAEAQAAYAQIVCRALFQERVQGGEKSVRGEAEVAVKAELILHRYLDTTLDDLGPLAPDARRLLADHLVTADGCRTLRTEKELLRILPMEKLQPILAALEGAAILHAEAHQGSRYFEIGHDWLARKVYEQRQERERAEEERRREEEQAAAMRAHRAEAESRLAKARAQRRFLAGVALVSILVALGAAGLTVRAQRAEAYATKQQAVAEQKQKEAHTAQEEAKDKAIEANDAQLLAGFRELKNSNQLAWATKLLPEVKRPGSARGWVALASDALRTSMLERTLGGHRKTLTAAAWSPDGRRVLAASEDGDLRIESADGSTEPVVLKHDDKPITAAAWSPDGKRVLTGFEDGTARIEGADGKAAPVALEGHAHSGAVLAASFSGDGARVVLAWRGDATARVFRDDGTGMVALEGHKAPIMSAVFFPDGRRVLTTSDDKTARVWSAPFTGTPVVLDGHTDVVVFAAPSPDGTRVVTTSRDRTARVWDASGKGKPVVLEPHDGCVVHAAWSPDGTRVATASEDRIARVFRADGSGAPVLLRGHAGAVTFVAFRPGGRYVATASADKTGRLWPVEGGASFELTGHDAPLRSVAWSPDGSRVLTAAGIPEKRVNANDDTARIWRTTLLESLARQRTGFFHSAFIGPAGERVVSAYDDRKARLWRVDGAGSPVVFEGHKDWIASAALSPDGKRVVTASFDGTARLFGADGAFEQELAGHTGPVRAASFSPDGARVVTASDDGTARVWSADGKGDPAVLRGHADALTSASWSPDGQRIVTTSLDDTARLWRADGTFERELRGHGGGVYAASWSPDGKRVVTSSEDGTAQGWDATSGAPLVMLEHKGAVLCATFSPDGTRIATSSVDGKVSVWSADGKGEPVELEAPPMLALTFLDGGKALLGVGADDTTFTWTIDVGALREGLAAAGSDCLPEDKRITYIGESKELAAKNYAACAHRHPALREVDRVASRDDGVQASAGPKLKDAAPTAHGAGERRVSVFVLPGDATVESDGNALRRRDGVIDVLIKAGDARTLKAIRGRTETKVPEKAVTLQEAAKPAVVDLNDRPPPAKGAGAGKPARFSFGDE
jgi:WD40 repeat protein